MIVPTRGLVKIVSRLQHILFKTTTMKLLGVALSATFIVPGFSWGLGYDDCANPGYGDDFPAKRPCGDAYTTKRECLNMDCCWGPQWGEYSPTENGSQCYWSKGDISGFEETFEYVEDLVDNASEYEIENALECVADNCSNKLSDDCGSCLERCIGGDIMNSSVEETFKCFVECQDEDSCTNDPNKVGSFFRCASVCV